ncbi:unnamed protein product [Camellia sinensis]
MASDLCIERKDSKWEIRDSPAKKQRCKDYSSPLPLCSLAEKEKEDLRSKVVFYNYDDSDVEEDSDGKHEFTDRKYQEYNRQIIESDKEHTNLEFVKVVKVNVAGCAGFLYYITFDVRDAAAVNGGTMEFQAFVWDGIAHTEVLISRLKTST